MSLRTDGSRVARFLILAALLGGCGDSPTALHNQPPTATITAPTEDAGFVVGDEITFAGSATDPEDGPLSGGALVWTSSISGQIGTGASFSSNALAEGTHTITLTGTDRQGATGSASVSITVQQNQAPTAAISSPNHGVWYYLGENLTFAGTATDPEEGELSGNALVWTSDVDGELGRGTSIDRDDLTESWHTITLTATDSHGAIGSATITIQIRRNDPPVPTITSPADGGEVLVGQGVTFSGTATDTEDGELEGESLVWTSSIGGQIGTGRSFVRGNLSVGTHVITLTATDSWGGSAAATVTLHVREASLQAHFASLSGGAVHTCALIEDGTAFCWGRGSRGSLGEGRSDEYTRRVPVAVAGNLQFSSIHTGRYRSCALTADSIAYCWGENQYGAVGDGSTEHRSAPAAVAGGIRFASISTGGNHSCGLTQQGEAYCWGFNYWGQLGDDTNVNRPMPTPVETSLRFEAISAGNIHTCALTESGQAFCWGSNNHRRLGDGTVFGRKTPRAVQTTLRFKHISAGYEHTCAITTGGVAYCWGNGSTGRLGTGDTEVQGVPTAVSTAQLFTGISSGDIHTCGISSEGVASCWGSNSWGQLGDGTREGKLTPAAVSGNLRFTTISPGGSVSPFTCGLDSAGGAWCWGDGSRVGNENGQSNVPVQVYGGDDPRLLR